MPRPLTYVTTPTRLVLRTLVASPKEMWTGEIAEQADVSWETASNVLKRLLSAEWVTSSRESAESAAQRVSAPRRYWELTEEGREAAIEVVEANPAAARKRSATKPGASEGRGGGIAL